MSVSDLEKKLSEAKDARHRLLTGTHAVTVSLDGYGSTTYTQGSIKELGRYIAELERDIAKANGKARRGIIRARF